MKPMPIKWRIGLFVAGTLVAVIVSLSCVAYHEMEESLKGNIDDSLAAMASGIRSALDVTDNPDALEEEIRAITGNSPHGRMSIYRVWLEGSDRDISASGPAESVPAAWLRQVVGRRAPSTSKPLFMDLTHGERYRAIWARYGTTHGTANVLILRSSEHAYGELREFLHLLLVLGGSVIIGSVIVVTVLVLLALRPVGQTAARLQGITHRNLGTANLAGLKPPAELEPFIDAVSQLLSRLDEALQRQEQFTSDASHEIRTPLALAKSTLQAICVKDRQPTEYKQAIVEAVQDLDRIEQLTEQLLLLSRMDATGHMHEATDVQLDALLGQLAEAFDKTAAQTGSEVICKDLPPTLVHGIEQQLNHLFGNLLDNAVKHGPSGRPIRITLQHDSKQACTVCIHDEGHISAESLPRIFDRFYRSDSSRTRATGGSGLGLAIARKIARVHGGNITIQSDPASGTCVLVRLPLRTSSSW